VFGSGTASQQSDASLTVGKWPEPAIGIGIILCKPPDYTKWQTSWILMALKYFITYPGRSVDDRVWTPGVSQPCTPWVRENACGKLLRQTSICRLLLDAMWIAMWISIWDNLSAYIHILGSTHIYIIYPYMFISILNFLNKELQQTWCSWSIICIDAKDSVPRKLATRHPSLP